MDKCQYIKHEGPFDNNTLDTALVDLNMKTRLEDSKSIKPTQVAMITQSVETNIGSVVPKYVNSDRGRAVNNSPGFTLSSYLGSKTKEETGTWCIQGLEGKIDPPNPTFWHMCPYYSGSASCRKITFSSQISSKNEHKRS